MKIPFFDAHCDTSYRIYENGWLLRNNPGHIDLTRCSRFSPHVRFFAIFAEKEENITDKYYAQIANIKDAFLKNDDLISLCTCKSDAERAIAGGKIAAFLSVEGGELLGCSEEILEQAFSEGVRAVNITWNYQNALSGSNAEGYALGLTEKGRSFVKKCGDLGMIVDVSHISDPAFWDIMEIPNITVMASHSNSRAVWNHPRNLTDRQFLAIIERGGVVGINLYSLFLGNEPTLDTVYAHISHFLALGGEKNIGIGADFDGCDCLPSGIADVEDIILLYDYLLQHGIAENVVNDIFYNNFMSLIH